MCLQDEKKKVFSSANSVLHHDAGVPIDKHPGGVQWESGLHGYHRPDHVECVKLYRLLDP